MSTNNVPFRGVGYKKKPGESSGFHSYNPVSTLELQNAQPVGRRIHLFIRTNPNCCLTGGVETLLKLTASSDGRAVETFETQDNESSNNNNNNNNNNPFAFLQTESSRDASNNAAASATKKKPHQQVGQFFKKVAKQTQQGLERGMTNLAIKADQGKNPDWLVLGLYDATETELYCMTESMPLPVTDYERMKGVTFRIPLTVPPHLVAESNAAKDGTGMALVIKLWIRSGAPLLKQTARNYLLGSCQTTVGRLLQQIQQPPHTSHPQFPSTRMSIVSMPLRSSVVVDGQLHVLMSPDLKFPPLCGRGWSLTDPDMSGYASEGLFHLPLDQTYAYNHKSDWLIGTERSTESSVVLPIATAWSRLTEEACKISLAHATSVASTLLANRHNQPPQVSPQAPSQADGKRTIKADCWVGIGYLLLQDASRQATATNLSMHWQRPDTIFEVEILPNTRIPVHTVNISFRPNIQQSLYPKAVPTSSVLPSLLSQLQQEKQAPFLLGCLRFQLQMSTPKASGVTDSFAPIGTGSQAIISEEETWQTTISLESYLNRPNPDEVLQVPVFHAQSGVVMGTIVLQLRVQIATPNAEPSNDEPLSSRGGLVSLVGLDTLLEQTGTAPILDFDPADCPPTQDASWQRRQQQVRTMGNFLTHQHLQQHVSQVRSNDASYFADRTSRYQMALSYNPQSQVVSAHQDRNPKPFRPSSSRPTELLAGLPFNVHNATIALETYPPSPQQSGDLFSNITCGAPSDHARGFGQLYPGGPSGGLRRLETKRLELFQQLQDAQTALIQAVGTYFSTARGQNISRPVSHVPARHSQIAQLRWKVFEITQNLHKTTWGCAVRRANVFSQTVGIAVTAYLAGLSEAARAATWADLWVKHGYLMTFDGLLSAAGKELGMIEDASVGISMIRNVSVIIVPADNSPVNSVNKVLVPNSPYLRWIDLSSSGVGTQTQYRLLVGLDPIYYGQRLPEPLKGGAEVRLVPLLFQVGVDIRQWGAHTQMNVKNQLTMKQEIVPNEAAVAGGLLDDDDDDEGVTDTDFLVSLNTEALRKINVYAHSISPVQGVNDAASENVNPKVHPVLSNLYQLIMVSSGRMNHGILDEAFLVTAKLGGGGVVFCKSGKDRTAMHVTHKQSRFMHRYRSGNAVTAVQVLEDATLLRVYGTRLAICEKNVGQAKYAFNTLQVRFMPDALKPPIQTLAGFLKGGAVFQKGGGIES